MRQLAVTICIVLSMSCAAKYEAIRSGAFPEHPRLPGDASFVVVVSDDGSFAGKLYGGSGKATTMEIVRALSTCSSRVEAMPTPGTLDEGVEHTKALGLTHYVHPTIQHWEDRATEWSGKRDKISILLQVVDVGSGEMIDSMTLNAKSKSATFGGDHPQELLPKLLDEYVSGLCR